MGSCVVVVRGEEGPGGVAIFVCGEVGRMDKMGEGAWICMEMAKVGATGAGTRTRLMGEAGGGRRDGVELCRGRT